MGYEIEVVDKVGVKVEIPKRKLVVAGHECGEELATVFLRIGFGAEDLPSVPLFSSKIETLPRLRTRYSLS